MLALELIPAMRERLAQLEGRRGEPRTSGERAALWRAQQYAARIDHTVEDLRRYCLQWLGQRRLLDSEHENDYLRGYRDGFQGVLREIRRVQSAPRRQRPAS